MSKKVIFSGIQPSGCVTIGNYLGALRNWCNLQNSYQCYFSVVDLHSLTVRQNPDALRESSLNLLALLISAGINPEDNLVFFQSHVGAHSELAWILNCYTYLGELSRMTQFKDKSRRNEDNVNAGLFTYPVLMAADILLYNADLVPVGVDQKQHLELARVIAQRFNGIYGDLFKVPEPYIPEVGAKIQSLTDPASKMSKSDPNPNSYISILDPPDTIVNKIKRAVTDSDGVIEYKDGKDGINNLLSIYAAFTQSTPQQVAGLFAGKGYGELKKAVAECVVQHLTPLQTEFARIRKDSAYLEGIYNTNGQKAAEIAQQNMQKVRSVLGLVV